MNISVILLTIGIVLNTKGMVLIFYFALSPYIKSVDFGHFNICPTNEEHNTDSKTYKKRKKYRLLSKIGLCLCIAGGILQIIALFF